MTRAVLAMRSRAAGALPPEEHEKHLAAQRTIPTRMAHLQARLSDEHRPYHGSDRRDPVRADLRRNPTRDQLRRAAATAQPQRRPSARPAATRRISVNPLLQAAAGSNPL